jgi:ArsR family transcriptional regulator
MLAYARMKLERAGLAHAQVRHGDLYNVPLPDGAADVVVLHQVLHFLDDPGAALAEAARLLAPGGKLLVVDFAPHGLEFLREQAAHRRLGFARDQLARLFGSAGLKLDSFRELKAEPAAGKLTVSLWLGSRPAVATRKKRPSPKVEVAA